MKTSPERFFVLLLLRFVALSTLRTYSLLAALLALLVVMVTVRDAGRTFLIGPGKSNNSTFIHYSCND